MDNDDLIHGVAFGIETEAFLQSTLGRYLVKQAEMERDAALGEFKTADTADTKLMAHIQNRVWRAESFQTWLAEIVQAGWNSEALLKQQESTD
jgi:hypothetical protein